MEIFKFQIKKKNRSTLLDIGDREFRSSWQQFVEIVYTFYIELLYTYIYKYIWPYTGCSKLYQTFL